MDTIVRSSADFQSCVDYYQRGQLSHFPQEHRTGGSFGIQMMQVDQDAAEFFDPPFSDFGITGIVSKSVRAEIDFGNGWTQSQTFHGGFVGPQPVNQECGFRIRDAHSLIVAAASGQIVAQQLERIGITSDPFRSIYGNFDHSPAMMSLLKAMWAAMETGGPANNLLVDGYYIALLGQMLQDQTDRTAFALVPDLANPQLRRVIDYIEAHFDAPLLTSELAGIAAMSTAQFGRSFKAATGYSPHHYVTVRRVDHAKRMLRQGELTITQIAYCCGFSSAAHFATTFRQHVGIAPSNYRLAVT
jgi:AraC-like DNA-binding protein